MFVGGADDFPGVCTEFCEWIGVDNSYCKSAPNHLKIQTANPEVY
jgi:hypothetical protein